MNRILYFIALLLVSFAATAQSHVAGIRSEVAEVTVNDEDVYTLFTYTDDDGTFGYYLSLGHVDERFSLGGRLGTFSFSSFDEVCLCMGADRDEAFASFDTLLALFDREPGTVIELPARVSKHAVSLGQHIDVACEVRKKLLGGRRLWFYFPSDSGREGVVYLNKSSVKQLRWGLGLDKKMHPDK